jgi:hypothetical protein
LRGGGRLPAKPFFIEQNLRVAVGGECSGW